PSSACYTDAGARAAGESNLAKGVDLPADAVDLFMSDDGVDSLGHRRWCLAPAAGVTAFGHTGQSTCMYSFGMRGPGPAGGYDVTVDVSAGHTVAYHVELVDCPGAP